MFQLYHRQFFSDEMMVILDNTETTVHRKDMWLHLKQYILIPCQTVVTLFYMFSWEATNTSFIACFDTTGDRINNVPDSRRGR
jgi:hypothetical protein